jgi:hypothetical protein
MRKQHISLITRDRMLGFIISFLLLSALSSDAADHTLRIRDKSDWWSVLNESFRDPKIKTRKTALKAGNFQIMDVSLGDSQLEQIEAKLGTARIVSRGDASSARDQLCYVSADKSKKVYVIFEVGEVEYSVYLFADGPAWKGSDLCVGSKLISENSQTNSGLRLGLTQAQLKAILGKPDGVIGNKLLYSRAYKKSTPPEEFWQLRKNYPRKLNDKEAHELLDSFDVQLYIEARFENSKLNYIAISKSETN